MPSMKTNVLVPLPVIFVVYDFFYTLLHWALHDKSVYGYIHKHHHHQKAPRLVLVHLIAYVSYFLIHAFHFLADIN